MCTAMSDTAYVLGSLEEQKCMLQRATYYISLHYGGRGQFINSSLHTKEDKVSDTSSVPACQGRPRGFLESDWLSQRRWTPMSSKGDCSNSRQVDALHALTNKEQRHSSKQQLHCFSLRPPCQLPILGEGIPIPHLLTLPRNSLPDPDLQWQTVLAITDRQDVETTHQ